MHKKFFMLCLITLLAAPANARKVVTFEPLQAPAQNYYNEYQNFNQSNMANNHGESYPKITQLEFSIFRRTYEAENIYNRLTRLENKLFKRSFQNMPLSTRVDNLLANVDTGIMNGINPREVANLERKILGQTFQNEDTDSRITRLEKEMLGAMQPGNITERFNTIKTAARHYNAYPEITGQSANSPSFYKSRGINGILNNILGAMFGDLSPGTMTGYTPPIYDSYNQYTPNNGMGMQDYYMGNHGGYMDNRNIGTGSTVRILD